ncbi:MAG TPA: hypothetical protein VFF52_06160 [Isosphaeraceae bacterium]|nr:hypothetical protein [Isosphaeraceae bacterium]
MSWKSARIIRPVVVTVAVQLLLALATALIKLHSGSDDTDIYYRYATMAMAGEVPYRDYRVEYPPLALLLFLVPGLIVPNIAGFKFAFAVEMLAFNAATVWAVAAWVERREGPARVWSRLAWYTVFFVFLARLMVARYDAVPMLLGFVASTWWFSGRSVLGGLAASLGALTKVYPAVVAVLASTWDLTRPGSARGRGLVAFSLASTLGATAWLALGGFAGVSQSLGYQLGRGFEYGSLYSGAQMLAAKLVGAEIVIARDHAAWSSITPWSQHLSALVFPTQLVAILTVCLVFQRRGMTEGVRYTGAAILAFVVTSKVFSPQYLIWLIPFIAILEGPIARRGCWLFAAGCAATLLAPATTNLFPRTSAWVILAYNLKNVLFLALLGLLTFGPGLLGQDKSQPGPAASAPGAAI